MLIFTARIRRMGEGTVFSLFVSSHLGGGPRSRSGGGVPGPGQGGVPGLRSRGGTWSQIQGGYPVSDLGGYLVSDPGGGVLPSVKGKNFDTRFGLIHVQTRKKICCQGTPPPLQ